MPIYEYESQECGLEFEKLILSRPADDMVACPACKSREVHKLLSLVSATRGSDEASAAASAGCATGA